jgi:hypothetical protein
MELTIIYGHCKISTNNTIILNFSKYEVIHKVNPSKAKSSYLTETFKK